MRPINLDNEIMNRPTDTSIYRFINSNILEKNVELKDLYMDDPTVMGFNFYVDINDYYSPLFTESHVNASAIDYLKKVREPAKAMYLTEFKYRLRDLITRYPYYLQSVSGLNEIYKYNPKETWRAKDKRLTFKTLESIDLKIGNMIDKYIRATFDEEYMREMLPINLRKFNAYLVVSEIRNFKTFYNTVVNGGESTRISVLNDFLSCYVYKLDGCRFDFSESNPWMETISNAKSDAPSENQFSVVFDRIHERHKMNIIEAYAGQTTDIEDKDAERYRFGIDGQTTYRKSQWGVPGTGDFKEIEKIENQVEQTLDKKTLVGTLRDYILDQPEIKRMQAEFDPLVLRGRAENAALDKFRGVLGQAVLGNVFDIRNQLFTADINQLVNSVLRGNTNVTTPGIVQLGGKTVYKNNLGNLGRDGKTVYTQDQGIVAVDSPGQSSASPIGDDDNTGITQYNNNIGTAPVDSPNTVGAPNSILATDNPSIPNTGSLGQYPNVLAGTNLDYSVLNIYNITPEIVTGLGSDFTLVHSVDFFRAFLGNVGGVEGRPFSNLLATLVGGVIPNLVKREANIT